jgi:hypothetical protein
MIKKQCFCDRCKVIISESGIGLNAGHLKWDYCPFEVQYEMDFCENCTKEVICFMTGKEILK